MKEGYTSPSIHKSICADKDQLFPHKILPSNVFTLDLQRRKTVQKTEGQSLSFKNESHRHSHWLSVIGVNSLVSID